MEVLHVPSNGMTFYCERRGQGPLVVLVPSGCNDCGPLAKTADILAERFTVLTMDMRGGTRSMPPVDTAVTPKMLAEDIVGIVRALGYEKASFYGCSSGGQTVLAIGKYFPEAAQNLIVFEAALQMDTPIPNTGYEYFETVGRTFGPLCKGFVPKDVYFKCDWEKWTALGPEIHERTTKNAKYWATYYLGTVDRDTYTEEELKRMPNLEFAVGAWTPSWMTAANIANANRAGVPYTWLPSSHYPEVVCPEKLAEFIRTTCEKYLP